MFCVVQADTDNIQSGNHVQDIVMLCYCIIRVMLLILYVTYVLCWYALLPGLTVPVT